MSTLAQKARHGRILALQSLEGRNVERHASVISFRTSRQAIMSSANTLGYQPGLRTAA